MAGAIAAMAMAAMAIAADEARAASRDDLRRAAQAEGITIEQDAVIGRGILEVSASTMARGLRGMVLMIKVNGWKCDSVSGYRILLLSRGFEITCNRRAYTYIVEDRGGQLTVRLD